MTRGNQRELARQKQAKKQAALQKSTGASEKDGNKGMKLEERRLRLVFVYFIIFASEMPRR
ncbi:unnamed protein product [Echinostoma caproni]|uniref:4F5 domain-containing protein n=1 Tax=Echinostoma caproni TaxID=27848 RepID=A0A183BGW5_9TREM|nr:unnamed protein product [Echinostoma caproni]